MNENAINIFIGKNMYGIPSYTSKYCIKEGKVINYLEEKSIYVLKDKNTYKNYFIHSNNLFRTKIEAIKKLNKLLSKNTKVFIKQKYRKEK